jgi:diguanylate cyclase (GGDEF)-like protein
MQIMKPDMLPADPLSKVKLLFVEDEPATRLQIASQLSRLVAEVITAVDGSEGLRLFRDKHPDMVLTDISMPVLDGLSLAAIIKRESPDTPVIALTVHSEDQFLRMALDVGFDGYLVKPAEPGSLAPVLFKNARQVLQRRHDEARSRLFSYLLDINPHLIVSASGGMMDYANNTFLQYVGQAGVDSLLSGAPGLISELQVAGSRYLLNDSSWISKLSELSGQLLMVCFSARGEACARENSFWVTSQRFPDLDRVIVTFTDITPLEREREHLLYRANTDSLTGIFNRFKLTEYINAEFVRYQRYKMPVCLIMFDIDFFKQVNDTLGHAVGDNVLMELATIVSRNVRDTDSLGRWGGEEFMILAPLTTLADALELAERLRGTIASSSFPGVDGLTCSFGVAALNAEDTVNSLLGRVDHALYKSKNNGRNRVESA